MSKSPTIDQLCAATCCVALIFAALITPALADPCADQYKLAVGTPAWTDATSRCWAAELGQSMALDRQIAANLEHLGSQPPQIGMTADQVRDGWSAPWKVNRLTTASGVEDQWVYGGDLGFPVIAYLYFRNGILTAIQQPAP